MGFKRTNTAVRKGRPVPCSPPGHPGGGGRHLHRGGDVRMTAASRCTSSSSTASPTRPPVPAPEPRAEALPSCSTSAARTLRDPETLRSWASSRPPGAAHRSSPPRRKGTRREGPDRSLGPGLRDSPGRRGDQPFASRSTSPAAASRTLIACSVVAGGCPVLFPYARASRATPRTYTRRLARSEALRRSSTASASCSTRTRHRRDRRGSLRASWCFSRALATASSSA